MPMPSRDMNISEYQLTFQFIFFSDFNTDEHCSLFQREYNVQHELVNQRAASWCIHSKRNLSVYGSREKSNPRTMEDYCQMAHGASPRSLDQPDTFKVVMKFEDIPNPVLFSTATNDNEECIHVQYIGNPPSPTDIEHSSSEKIPQISNSVQSEGRLYISPAELLDSDSDSSRCGGASTRVVESGIDEFHVSLVDRRELLIAKLGEKWAEEGSELYAMTLLVAIIKKHDYMNVPPLPLYLLVLIVVYRFPEVHIIIQLLV